MGFFVFLFLLLIVSVVFVILQRVAEDDEAKTIFKIFKYITAGGVLLMFLLNSYFIVDEGEGVILLQFNKIYGSEVSPGFHVCRPWADVIDWQIRLKAVDVSLDARTKDEMRVTVDATYWWAVMPSKLEELYRNVAKNYDMLEKGFTIPGVRSGLRDKVAEATYTELNANRETHANIITTYVAKKMVDKYIIIDKVNIRNLTPPPAVDEAIQQKLQMEQKKQAADHTLELETKNANIRRVQAQGIADAQSIIQKKLTPIYVQYEGIQMMKELSQSPNTTFIFAPTSMTGIGLPAVHQAPIK